MLAFLSYARADLATVLRLEECLRLLGWQVWKDLQTGGGQDWWAAILEQVRACDLFVAALSPAGVDSLACSREREYATALGKPVLPVRLAPFPVRTLPPALARINLVDLTVLDAMETGIHLANAVRDVPPAPPLPVPPPPEPAVPLSYLAEIGELVRAADLTLRDQMAVAAMLREALARPRDHDDARDLARRFADREDLYVLVHRQVQELLDAAPRTGPEDAGAQHPASLPPVEDGPPQPAARDAPAVPPRSAARDAPAVPPRSAPRDAPAVPPRSEPAADRRPFRTDPTVQRVLTGHLDDVNAVTFSPDGTLLASAADDRTVRLWDPTDGRLVRTLTGHDHWVYDVAFSPFTTLLASASRDGTVRLWDPATGACVRTLTGHGGPVWSVAFSPVDALLVATGGHDRTVRLWNPATGDEEDRLTGFQDAAYGLAFSPDGQRLAVAGDAVQLWDLAVDRPVRRFEGHAGAVYGVAFAPDGGALVTSGRDGSIRVLDPAGGRLPRTPLQLRGPVRAVSISPDGALLAGGSEGGTVLLADPVIGSPAQILVERGAAVGGLAFSPDGTLLATGGAARSVRLWG